MVDEKEETKEEIKEPTREEMAARWESYVRNEVNALLDVYLPASLYGNVGVKYANPVREKYETHEVIDDTKAVGVSVTLMFTFDGEIDVPKAVPEKEKK